jgi:hypothetical protein
MAEYYQVRLGSDLHYRILKHRRACVEFTLAAGAFAHKYGGAKAHLWGTRLSAHHIAGLYFDQPHRPPHWVVSPTYGFLSPPGRSAAGDEINTIKLPPAPRLYASLSGALIILKKPNEKDLSENEMAGTTPLNSEALEALLATASPQERKFFDDYVRPSEDDRLLSALLARTHYLPPTMKELGWVPPVLAGEPLFNPPPALREDALLEAAARKGGTWDTIRNSAYGRAFFDSAPVRSLSKGARDLKRRLVP